MQREVSRKLYAQLPELSQLLDRTLARAPKEEYGPPPSSLWHRLVVSLYCNMLQMHAITRGHKAFRLRVAADMSKGVCLSRSLLLASPVEVAISSCTLLWNGMPPACCVDPQ